MHETAGFDRSVCVGRAGDPRPAPHSIFSRACAAVTRAVLQPVEFQAGDRNPSREGSRLVMAVISTSTLLGVRALRGVLIQEMRAGSNSDRRDGR